MASGIYQGRICVNKLMERYNEPNIDSGVTCEGLRKRNIMKVPDSCAYRDANNRPLIPTRRSEKGKNG